MISAPPFPRARVAQVFFRPIPAARHSLLKSRRQTIALSHLAVQEAAVVARPDERWTERPLLVVVRRPDCSPSEEDLLAHYTGKVARWWAPDSVVFVDELPRAAAGKLLKTRIRELYGIRSR